ncbi:MFS transporter [Alicyclobacillus fastidiosus]|uniref:MFS transporter n=1 Tax=Alicyclobacillus fastidiosus TaxID=392011 RepID=A0ABV5AF21_9BACL|nr:MFS transporter [Alicyclobacillus fastidiosus]WEH09485.1 MFS transporter [Alicyclobacillus fastidiosus]
MSQLDLASAPVEVRTSHQVNAIIGSWASWLFDAMDAGIFSFVLLAVAHTFKTSLSGVTTVVAWFLLATGVGGYVFGNISDRIGRKRTLWISVLIYGLGTLMCGFVQNMLELNIFRIIVGVAVGGLWSAAAALISEVSQPESRAKALAVMQTGWSGGQLLAAILAWTILNPHNPESWRWLFIDASIPAWATAVYILLFVKESPIWLANRNYIARTRKSQNMLSIFNKEYVRTTSLALLVSMLGMVGYWIILTFVPSYLQNILGINMNQTPVFSVWTAVGAIIGYLVYGYIAEIVGRRISFAIFFFGMTAIIPIFTYVASHMPLTNGHLLLTGGNVVTLGIISALLGFFTGYFSGFGAWYGELFPTSIRATASGFCFNVGRIGSIVGILLAPVLISSIGFSMFIALASISYFASGLLVFTIRETKGTTLTADN